MTPSVNTEQKFKRAEKVVATADLPGVPAGTEGRIYYEAGFRWVRYHVGFENGVELGNVDGNSLMSLKAWKAKAEADQIEARRQAKAAEQDALVAIVREGAGPAAH